MPHRRGVRTIAAGHGLLKFRISPGAHVKCDASHFGGDGPRTIRSHHGNLHGAAKQLCGRPLYSANTNDGIAAVPLRYPVMAAGFPPQTWGRPKGAPLFPNTPVWKNKTPGSHSPGVTSVDASACGLLRSGRRGVSGTGTTVRRRAYSASHDIAGA
jgi:hypothetical protein